MKLRSLNGLLAALAVAGAGVAGGVLATAPAGCASNCGTNCPNTIAVIETAVNVDPGITGIGAVGPACPVRVDCRGDDRTTFCNHINVSALAEGYCDVLIALGGREPMAVRIEFGPPSTQGCCKGYPVVGEWHFIIPLDADAGIQGVDGSSDAVRVLRDGGPDGADAPDGADDGATDDGATDDGGGAD